MKRNVSMDEISDGRLYTANDMVKADTCGCSGCSACCHGMGTSIILDPMDAWRLCRKLDCDFSALMDGHVELNVVDGIILPNLVMSGPQEACSFLDAAGRCSIHDARPGICRLFPLGRYYEGRDFRYFLQIHECSHARTKVKVKKWLDTPELSRYEDYIRSWHYFLEDAQRVFGDNENLQKQINVAILQAFFMTPWEENDFYEQYEERLAKMKQYLSI